jgi:filamentous hemagglutinin
VDVTSYTIRKLIFGIPHSENGIIAHTLSAFAGPHDYLSSWNYENIDINGQTNTVLKDNGTLVNVASGALLIPSIPFAAAPFIQNNISELNLINFLKKQEDKKAEEFINKAKNEGIMNENN